MASGKTTFPSRRAAAERNRDKILSAARDAFADPAAEVSMAEVARRAGVGMATLYRNFPGRRELLEALYADEVDALCAAAVTDGAQPAGTALITWLRRQFAFIPSKRQIVAELLKHAGPGDPAIPRHRARALAAGRPLLTAAQNAGEIRDDLSLEQIFDLIVAIATIDGPPEYLEPIIEAMLDGLRWTGSRDAAGGARQAGNVTAAARQP
jgi:AcrR family transcriptional regulator